MSLFFLYKWLLLNLPAQGLPAQDVKEIRQKL